MLPKANLEYCNLSFFQVDLRHQEEEQGNNVVSIGVDLSEFYMSVEWDILAVPAIRNVKYYTCCDEPYLDITFNITMRRKTLFYTVNLIIPCMGISFLTVLVSNEKVFFTYLMWMMKLRFKKSLMLKSLKRGQKKVNITQFLTLADLKMVKWLKTQWWSPSQSR